ncbi:MAG: hypothetical protein R3E66_19805 [bacterium]
MAVVVEHEGQLQLMLVNLETPEIFAREPLLSAGLDRPTHPLIIETENQNLVVVRTDRAEMTCMDLQSGECVWRYRPADEESLLIWTLPVFRVRDSLLCAGERLVLHDLQTGEVLHHLTDVFEAPEFLHAGGRVRMIVGESGDVGQNDTLTCYSIEHFLALVS